MNPQEIFEQLGFNSLEANVYIALIKHGPQTAYKVAKLIGKPAANVYKAVEVLAREGAIEMAEDNVKICKAIPIAAVVQQLQSSYKRKTDQAIAALSQLQGEKSDEGIYKLQIVPSVFQRAREMLLRTENIAVIDAFPATLNELIGDINDVATTGTEVYVQAYAPVKLHKKRSVIVPEKGREAL